jgi:hypothetical protein
MTLREATSWALYWIGDAVSRISDGLLGGRLYRLYSRVMVTASDIQGDGPGPWAKASDGERRDDK